MDSLSGKGPSQLAPSLEVMILSDFTILVWDMFKVEVSRFAIEDFLG